MKPFDTRPFDREFPLERWFPLPDSTVRVAWDRSTAAIEGLIRRIDQFQDRALLSVFLSGSLGRMEGREDSDWDLIVVLDDYPHPTDREPWDEDRLAEFAQRFWKRIDPEGRRRPDPTGIYATPIQVSELADTRYRAPFADSPLRFGKRIQLFLDAQPIWGDRHSPRLAAYSFYGAGDFRDMGKRPRVKSVDNEGLYLFNDLIRYHRSLCTLTQWLPSDRPETRRLKLKLRFTRFLNYLGLLLPLADGIDRGRVGPTLGSRWARTPLERVLGYVTDETIPAAETLCRAYACFLRFLERRDPPEEAWQAIADHAARFRESACEILRAQPFLQRGRAADLLLL